MGNLRIQATHWQNINWYFWWKWNEKDAFGGAICHGNQHGHGPNHGWRWSRMAQLRHWSNQIAISSRQFSSITDCRTHGINQWLEIHVTRGRKAIINFTANELARRKTQSQYQKASSSIARKWNQRQEIEGNER